VQKASEVIGRAVVVREGGKTVGKIKDLILDQSGRQVLGFVISEGVFSTKVAPWMGVQAIGPDSVILGTPANVMRSDEAPDLKEILDKDLHIRGLRLQTTTGKDLGKIDDFEFDEHSGAVTNYELVGGPLSRHTVLPTPMTLEIGKDLAFVGPEAETTITKD
jgi:uncharacterized protein YrrD